MVEKSTLRARIPKNHENRPKIENPATLGPRAWSKLEIPRKKSGKKISIFGTEKPIFKGGGFYSNAQLATEYGLLKVWVKSTQITIFRPKRSTFFFALHL